MLLYKDLVPDPGNILQADVPMEEEEEEQEVEDGPEQNGVHHHQNGDVIGESQTVLVTVHVAVPYGP